MDGIFDSLILARWQFGLTTLYHFLFVPITLGMIVAVAIWQTLWTFRGKVVYLQLTRFFAKLFLINFAMGIVTGIVQEFQFGMNWSAYSRFVGDIFGAPLAFEGLIAFFLEATMIGLWIFGAGRLSPKLHLLTVWGTMIGTWTSAYFILAANAFMQNPKGYVMNEANGRAELVDFGAVLTNPVAIAQMAHTILASLMLAGSLIAGVAAWHLKRGRNGDVMRPALRWGLVGILVGGAGILLSGDQLALVMVQTQPMKMAAAEALYRTATGMDASFSIFTLGTPDGRTELFSVRVPGLLSFLSTHTFGGTVEGIDDLNAQYQQLYGPGDYAPTIWVTYWSFRWMMFFGFASMLVAIVGLWTTRGRRSPATWQWNVAIWTCLFPLVGILIGWIFTEMGRQPWLVFGLLKTEDGVSPNVPGWMVLLSVVAFTLVYGALAVVEAKLLLKAAHADPPAFGDGTLSLDQHDEHEPEGDARDGADSVDPDGAHAPVRPQLVPAMEASVY